MYALFYLEKFETTVSLFNEDISKWDVSRVTDMMSMFKYSKSFNQDISKWNVSRVTTMFQLFFEARSFNQVAFDTQPQTDAHTHRCTHTLTQDISKWDVSSVTSMYAMFAYAQFFDQDLSK